MNIKENKTKTFTCKILSNVLNTFEADEYINKQFVCFKNTFYPRRIKKNKLLMIKRACTLEIVSDYMNKCKSEHKIRYDIEVEIKKCAHDMLTKYKEDCLNKDGHS